MDDKLQTNFVITALYDENKVAVPVTKVGILPFIKGDNATLKLLFMKPKAESRHLGAPAFQIAKGTRRVFINDNWCDMREDDLRYADESFHETLLATALREGEEEVGLKASNICKLYDMGGFTFISASRGLLKPLHLYAAEIIAAEDFLPFEHTTAETRFMTPEEFESIGRPDHVKIMSEVVGRLKQVL